MNAEIEINYVVISFIISKSYDYNYLEVKK